MKSIRRAARLLPLCVSLLATGISLFAQAPTGAINGTVTDQSGGVVPNATVTVTDKATSSARTLTTNAEGYFNAPSLSAGQYEVKAEMQGFKTLVRDATVAAGSATTVDMAMSVGQASDVVNVEAAAAQVNYESHSVAGVVERTNIQELPINGRSFLSLATLEPGITTAPGTAAQFNSLISVTTLGGMGYTRFTLDGGIVNDEWEGTGTTGMNFSQEIVQEFQMSTVNFDISAGIAAGGQVNVVTRGGGND
ncbi:MAG TPA: carboxypeptidase-like regulatory domain-containing protein, partial [Bryobacteraceae bacterium]|nr:carboxypeptidase-like regulatory domain-containing protein [Bryobacteraceae bacterium]